MFADTAAEWRANAFAGHFLVPERGVRSVLGWLGETPGTVTERAAVALIAHFGVSLAALVYQLNVIGVLSSAAQQLRGCGVATLLAQHRDVALTGVAAGIRRTRRSPERLIRRALSAAREQRLGLSVVASLLERDDDQRVTVAAWCRVQFGHPWACSITRFVPSAWTSSRRPCARWSGHGPAGRWKSWPARCSPSWL